MDAFADIQKLTIQAPRGLGELVVSYQHFGQDTATHPVIMINHALTGDAQVTGANGWWNKLVGPKQTIDTEQYAIISFNIPGNGVLDSQLDSYTEYHTADIATIFREGLRQLGIHKLYALVGGSIGGCIGWEFMVQYGDLVERFIPIATDWKATDWLIANTYLQDQILQNSSKPVHDARIHAMLCYRTPESLAYRFQRTLNKDEDLFNVETWLRHHGDKLSKRFTHQSYLTVNHLLRSVNSERNGQSLAEVFADSQAAFYLIGIDTDLFFTPHQIKQTYEDLKSVGVTISYNEINSIHGHDAFLIEYEQMDAILKPIFNE